MAAKFKKFHDPNADIDNFNVDTGFAMYSWNHGLFMKICSKNFWEF